MIRRLYNTFVPVIIYQCKISAAHVARSRSDSNIHEPHYSRFGDKFLGIRDNLSQKRDCGSKRVKKYTPVTS